MSRPLQILYRDVDRTPFLYTLARCCDRRDLAVEIIRHRAAVPSASGTGQEWGALLSEGAVDCIAENYWGLQSYRANGAPFVSLVSVSNVWTDKLLVAPGIRTLRDLEGTYFAVRGSGPNSLFPQLWVHESGFEQIDCVVFPERETGRWGQWQKVADGTCQACMMAGIYLGPALAAGLRPLSYPAVEFAGGNIVLTTTELLVRERRAELQQLVDAVYETVRLFKTALEEVVEVVESECLGLLEEHFSDLDHLEVRRICEFLAEELSPEPVPTPEGVDRTRRMRLPTSPELAELNPMLMWDLSFARVARLGRSASETNALEPR